jgi:hypothetical protein
MNIVKSHISLAIHVHVHRQGRIQNAVKYDTLLIIHIHMFQCSNKYMK